MEREKTLILLKPDAVQRKLMGKIIQRIEEKNLDITALKLIHVDKAIAEEHYGEHKGKPFFGELIQFITAGPALAMIVEGPKAISVMRAMMGKTNPFEASPGTLRGDFGLDLTANLIHGSDSPESASREIQRFFGKVVA
ncbi:nucleoside-diphosphate kinase [Candidatus Acetothermia bacterium]|nr:nucleoside-diphosphate kinase [Candidatus Acetothermia bacterium]MBI3644083.1 nucleoside-diphosphate kinase [Candidatus Acetothermia bacterium]